MTTMDELLDNAFSADNQSVAQRQAEIAQRQAATAAEAARTLDKCDKDAAILDEEQQRLRGTRSRAAAIIGTGTSAPAQPHVPPPAPNNGQPAAPAAGQPTQLPPPAPAVQQNRPTRSGPADWFRNPRLYWIEWVCAVLFVLLVVWFGFSIADRTDQWLTDTKLDLDSGFWWHGFWTLSWWVLLTGAGFCLGGFFGSVIREIFGGIIDGFRDGRRRTQQSHPDQAQAA